MTDIGRDQRKVDSMVRLRERVGVREKANQGKRCEYTNEVESCANTTAQSLDVTSNPWARRRISALFHRSGREICAQEAKRSM